MLCPYGCIIAVNADDQQWTFEVAKRWDKDLDGALEKWKCPHCKLEFLTMMKSGVRVNQPLPIKIMNEAPA